MEAINNSKKEAEKLSELIPLYQTDGIRAVLGRDLHQFLEVRDNYTDWMKRMIAYGFAAGQDFSEISDKPTGAGRPRIDHIISLDMAKEISMIQRTEKGKQARQYFIECEKQLHQQVPDKVKEAIATMTRLEWIQVAMNAEQERLELEAKNRELEPKAEAYDSFLDADGSYAVGNVAKMLGLSQNKLFDRLRNEGVMIAKGAMRNTPYQKYMHHFSVKASEFERKDGTRGTSYTTRVQPSGIDFIRRKLQLPTLDPLPLPENNQ